MHMRLRHRIHTTEQGTIFDDVDDGKNGDCKEGWHQGVPGVSHLVGKLPPFIWRCDARHWCHQCTAVHWCHQCNGVRPTIIQPDERPHSVIMRSCLSDWLAVALFESWNLKKEGNVSITVKMILPLICQQRPTFVFDHLTRAGVNWITDLCRNNKFEQIWAGITNPSSRNNKSGEDSNLRPLCREQLSIFHIGVPCPCMCHSAFHTA